MVYRIGQRVRPKIEAKKLIVLALLSSLLAGSLATTYADSQGVSLLALPTAISKHLGANAATSIKTKSSKTTNDNKTGSAHQPAVVGTSPTTSATVVATEGLRTASCSLFPANNPALAGARTPQLRKAAQYEQLCHGKVFERVSFFIPTPTTVSQAQAQVMDDATTLKEFALYGVKPLVFMEPSNDSGNLDLNQYRSGAYDAALDAYFSGLKSAGVSSAMMGMWTYLPEGNLPIWSSVDPATFGANVTKTAQIQKKYFPTSQSTILLDSETYPSATSWSNGRYVSLSSYVQSIPKGLLDSVGLQGFPWTPPANQGGGALYDPKVYLRTDLLSEAAHALGVGSVWVNTGTFSRKYTQNSSQTVTVSPTSRQTMLNGVISQVKGLQAQGFGVAVHLFAEDKSTTDEATDWSYWQASPSSDPNTAVFTTLAHDAASANISMWLFDSDQH